MKIFWKLNVISVLYAVMVFIPIELLTNGSRISRLIGWDFNVTAVVIGISTIVSVIIFSIIIGYLTETWMNNRKSSFWSVLLWLPYFVLFTFIFTSLFPLNNPADKGGPGAGLLILGILILYPIYVLLLNAFSTFRGDKKKYNSRQSINGFNTIPDSGEIVEKVLLKLTYELMAFECRARTIRCRFNTLYGCFFITPNWVIMVRCVKCSPFKQVDIVLDVKVMENKFVKALELRKSGNHQKSNELFMELLQDLPENASVNYHCAWSFDLLGEESKAVPFYENAIKLGLSSEELEGAFLGLGSTYRTLGEYTESKRVFEKGLESFPNNKALQTFYSMTLYNLNEHSKAMELLLKCLADTTADNELLSYKKAINYYSNKLDEIWT